MIINIILRIKIKGKNLSHKSHKNRKKAFVTTLSTTFAVNA